MQKVFLDTNIVLDVLGEREGFYEAAAKILTLADRKKIKVYTSASSISNTYYLLSKYENYLLSKYENAKAAREKLRKFKLICNISITDDEVVEKAIHSDFKDFEDAMQYFSALATKCDIIITRNEKDFKNALVPVMNSESYLQMVGK